jgi:hypothetical protein
MSKQSAFKTLYDKAATVDQLATAYVELEHLGKECQARFKKAHNEYVELTMRSLAGEKCDLTTANNLVNELSAELDAYKKGMDIIMRVMEHRIPIETKDRIQTIECEYLQLKEVKNQLVKEFLEAAAKAVVIKEKISGIEYSTLALSTETIFEESFPGLVVLKQGNQSLFRSHVVPRKGFFFLERDMSSLFVEEVKKARDEHGQPIESQLSELSKEVTVLREIGTNKGKINTVMNEKLSNARKIGIN